LPRFEESFDDEHERLFKALYFVTGSRQDAEEIMQDAFMKLWERWDQIGRISDPTGYLFRVGTRPARHTSCRQGRGTWIAGRDTSDGTRPASPPKT
jgi:DNA-directed RNA polymerase specialized sigma24 family protein